MTSRADNSVLSIWWWRIDHVLFAPIVILAILSLVPIAVVSPQIAARIGYDNLHFFWRHLIFLAPAIMIFLLTSMLSERMVRVVGIVGMIITSVLIVLTLLIGPEVKGATRWIELGSFKLQPSEFAKPFFAISCAWLLALWQRDDRFYGRLYSFFLCAFLAILLIQQPDIGMTFIFFMTWAVMIFLTGMSLAQIGSVVLGATVAIPLAYLYVPHFTLRVDKFLEGGDGQSKIALSNFADGGLFGLLWTQNGKAKIIPDAHSDFIYAATAAELGAFFCLLLLSLYAWIVIRSFSHTLKSESLFTQLAIAGLAAQFGLQAGVHMASSVHLIPTKGMTLPLISYGGSSLVTVSLTLGMLMALTRRESGNKPPSYGEQYG